MHALKQRTMALSCPSPTSLARINPAEESTPRQTVQQDTEIAAFYVHNCDFPQGKIFHTPKPDDISMSPPVVIRRPAFPEMRKLTMQILMPCIFYVQFPCSQKCRTMGICIHYQFVVGCRKCPDGLRCPVCVRSKVEQVWESSQGMTSHCMV